MALKWQNYFELLMLVIPFFIGWLMFSNSFAPFVFAILWFQFVLLWLHEMVSLKILVFVQRTTFVKHLNYINKLIFFPLLVVFYLMVFFVNKAISVDKFPILSVFWVSLLTSSVLVFFLLLSWLCLLYLPVWEESINFFLSPAQQTFMLLMLMFPVLSVLFSLLMYLNVSNSNWLVPLYLASIVWMSIVSVVMFLFSYNIESTQGQ